MIDFKTADWNLKSQTARCLLRKGSLIRRARVVFTLAELSGPKAALRPVYW
jgi:hypothetical protein